MEKTKETGRTKEAEGTSVKALGNGVVRLLRADEIECRIASISEKGVSLLLYKDARVDQKILDETFGVWTGSYTVPWRYGTGKRENG